MLLLWGSHSENQGQHLEVEFLGLKIHLVQPGQKGQGPSYIHLIRRINSLEKILMLGKIEG